MIRYLAAIAFLSLLVVSAVAASQQMRPESRLHPAPWVLEWKAGEAQTLHLTGNEGADLRVGDRALGIAGIGIVNDVAPQVLGNAEGCPEVDYTADDPGQTLWLPPGSTVEIIPCTHRPADSPLTLSLFTRSDDTGREIVKYFLTVDDTGPVISSPETGDTFTASAGSQVLTVDASDADGDSVSFSVSGGVGVFSIGATDGVLTVAAGARSGDYQLTITAVAGGESYSIEITVTVI